MEINIEELGNYEAHNLKSISFYEVDSISFPEDEGYECILIRDCFQLKNTTLVLPKYKKLKNIEIEYSNIEHIIFHPECTNVELINIQYLYFLKELNIPKTYKKLNWFEYHGSSFEENTRLTKVNLYDFKYLHKVDINNSDLTELKFHRECVLKGKYNEDLICTTSNKSLKRIITCSKSLPLYLTDPKAKVVSYEYLDDLTRIVLIKIKFKCHSEYHLNLPNEILNKIKDYIY